jgi:hypothetical protein
MKMNKKLALVIGLSLLLHGVNAQSDSRTIPLESTAKAVHKTPAMNVEFENVESEKIRECFLIVMKRYEELHDIQVTLTQRSVKSSTMQAQPVIALHKLFGKTNKYHVKLALYVRDSETMKVADLPYDVLIGWFAHELGHLVEYRPYSNFKMLFYGIRYLVSHRFKTEAEHAADYIAIRNGFRDEIIATKRYILDHDLLDEKYKAKIRRYYLPIEEAEVWQHHHIPGKPEPEL